MVAKSRYLTFDTSNVGCNAAIQVTLASSSLFPSAVGASWWVGHPSTLCENSGQSTPPPGGCGPSGSGPATYQRSTLACSAHCMDWSAVGTLHVSAEHVVPGAEYEIRAIDCGCDLSDSLDYSLPLSVSTSRWTDLCGASALLVCGSGPDGVVDFSNDILAILEKINNRAGSLPTARTDISGGGNGVDNLVTVSDLSAAVDSFQGGGFPFAGPVSCPAARENPTVPLSIPEPGRQ